MPKDQDFLDILLHAEVDECCTYTEVYWKMAALSKRRVWYTEWSWKPIRIGSDEYWRVTLSIGPLCIALWTTKEGRLIRKGLSEKFDFMLR